MTTEETYPFVHGGVSAWCDRLTRTLPNVEFALYAIPPAGDDHMAWTVPDNVTTVHLIEPSPSIGPDFRRYPRAARSDFIDAFDAFVRSILGNPVHPSRAFLTSLRGLFDCNARIPIEDGLRSAEAFDVLRDCWTGREANDRLAQMGPPSLNDVLEVTSSLARFLAPLAVVPAGDIVHTTVNGLGALPALAAKWTNDTPILLTEHGVYLRERYIAAHRAPGQRRVQAFNLLFFGHLNGAMHQAADMITPVSDYNAGWERQTGADPGKIFTIHNGVDPARFPAITAEPAVPTVTWIGRIDPLKDVVNLVRAFSFVHLAIPEARLRLFGPTPDGNEDYHAECVRVVGELGLHDVVTFEGFVSPVTEAHEAGHVVALSSISEGLPFTVIEAMMSGRATVSTDVGGVSEAVGEAGLLVPPGDPEAMGQALLRLLGDDEERRRLGRAARKRALRLLTLERMAARYRDAYAAVVSGGFRRMTEKTNQLMPGGNR